MKPFRFKKFEIKQNRDVFRVGTDAVIIGVLANVRDAKHILEVGSGTGIISLMLAQRNPVARILAIDINHEAVSISQSNFSNSPFSNRIQCKLQDFKSFDSVDRYDLIVSNPPYFEINDSVKDVLARQRLELNFSDLIVTSSRIISTNGILSVIIPTQYENQFSKICRENNLFLQRKIIVKGHKDLEPKRLILEYGFFEKKLSTELLVIEESPRRYTVEYLELTKEFHLFHKKPL